MFYVNDSGMREGEKYVSCFWWLNVTLLAMTTTEWRISLETLREARAVRSAVDGRHLSDHTPF